MKTIPEQKSRVAEHLRTCTIKKNIPTSVKRANIKSALNRTILEFREMNPDCDAAISEELTWIMSTSAIPEHSLQLLAKRLTEKLHNSTTAVFISKDISSDQNERRKISRWLNTQIRNNDEAIIDNMSVTRYGSNSKVKHYQVTQLE